MNILILRETDFTGPGRVRLAGRALRHVTEVHRAAVGAELAVGLLDGALGRGAVTRLDAEALEMEVVLDRPAPPKLPLTLVLALPRPKVLNRVLAAATSLGVARIYLVNAWKVEKSYWKSPRLEPENLLQQRILGLEQARDTLLPELHLRRLLRPFAEQELPELLAGTLPLLAHPGAPEPCPRAITGAATLVIGPEGGFLPAEVELLARSGCRPVHLGERILRVETAVAALVGRLY
jgi:RsmE family RNA methyltransferase